MFEHRGYTGVITDTVNADGKKVGVVKEIADSIFTGDTEEELRDDFFSLVDEYLDIFW